MGSLNCLILSALFVDKFTMGPNHLALQFIGILLPKKKLLLALALFGLIVGAVFVFIYPKRFSTIALLEVASLGNPDPSVASLGGGTPDLSRVFSFSGSKPSSKVTSTALTYLQVKYLDSPKNRLADVPYLVKLDATDSEQYLLLEIRATSQEDAQAFLSNLIEDLRNWYRPQVTDSLHDKAKQKVIVEEQIKRIRGLIKQIRALGDEMGYSMALAKQESELETALIPLQARNVFLETQITPEKIHNFSYAWVQSSESFFTLFNFLKFAFIPFASSLLMMLPLLLYCSILLFKQHLSKQLNPTDLLFVVGGKTGSDK